MVVQEPLESEETLLQQKDDESDLPLGGKVAIGFVTQQQRTLQLNDDDVDG